MPGAAINQDTRGSDMTLPGESFMDGMRRNAADTAAAHEPAFRAFVEANPLDARFYLKLLCICDGRLAEATVLWDAATTAAKLGLRSEQHASGADFAEKYGCELYSLRSFQQALASVAEAGLIEMLPGVRNTKRKFHLNWPALEQALTENVDNKLPGLRSQ